MVLQVALTEVEVGQRLAVLQKTRVLYIGVTAAKVVVRVVYQRIVGSPFELAKCFYKWRKWRLRDQGRRIIGIQPVPKFLPCIFDRSHFLARHPKILPIWMYVAEGSPRQGCKYLVPDPLRGRRHAAAARTVCLPKDAKKLIL